MTLIQKVNKELEKVGLEFKPVKELRDKFKGILIDKKNQVEIPYEVQKILQWDKVESFAKSCRDHINLYIQLSKMTKGGNQ